ncbi:MAG: hypothetical protein OXP36_04215 [Gammaproteobacteria bacterium]|nr:hypothetical protein [Gammaproteobacteria bacterium]
MNNASFTSFVVISLVVALCFTVGLLLHAMFAREITDFTTEILAAVLGVVLVVASVGVTIHYQSRFETQKEFRTKLFDFKIKAYAKFIEELLDASENADLDKDDQAWLDGAVAQACLVGETALVGVLTGYVKQCRDTSSFFPADGSEGHTPGTVVEALRRDLQVVSSDDEMEVSQFEERLTQFMRERHDWIRAQNADGRETEDDLEELDEEMTRLRIENRRLQLALDAALGGTADRGTS